MESLKRLSEIKFQEAPLGYLIYDVLENSAAFSGKYLRCKKDPIAGVFLSIPKRNLLVQSQ